ncbi:glycoside hydrolase family 43 protein [Flavihumibacter sp. UBA7668]|uniref:glycoside hydrolase family 43 protein n=1 Tax=Flavihumibacter sp. UBA7668 TaxID=1946542 RepID=UPI0025BAEA6D|nr:glycoside hydrolase family 43 protein [Flavihumibacter sp. UBA7668]
MDINKLKRKAISQPLVDHIYTADPSAHVFDGRIYIYPSHDVESNIPFDDLGSHFAMQDYHVLSMEHPGAAAVDHGVALSVADVPWASQQLWAPDAAEKEGKFYLFFPAKDKAGVFRIGVAVSDSPVGPFTAQPAPIAGSFSIDPAVYKDKEGEYYMYFGGIWGGQLQRWRTGKFVAEGEGPFAHLPLDTEPALCPKVVRLSEDLLSFAEAPRDLLILDENGQPLLEGDKERRFFEASWMHSYNGRYYFSYSTGDTHYICYAIGHSPYGPFTYAGRILEPVIGWTSHHSICSFNDRWYLFYHDSSLSEGVTHLRSVKMAELHHDENGFIKTIDPYSKKTFLL